MEKPVVTRCRDIGDVRDYNSILNAFRGVDYVFHAAALKQVPSCEFYPMEAVKTNVAGSDNVISACVEMCIRDRTMTACCVTMSTAR